MGDQENALDVVSVSYEPVRLIPSDRVSTVRLLVATSFGGGDWAILYQDEDNRTFLRGRRECLDLRIDLPHQGVVDSYNPTAAAGDITERECVELHRQRAAQLVLSGAGNAYVVTEAGVLYSLGDHKCGRLGRPTEAVPASRFGRVHIDGDVLAVATGWGHTLAMIATKVFVFGSNYDTEAGISGLSEIHEPRVVYSGKGSDAPRQVACGGWHSVVLTTGGQVLTCGRGGYTGQGHKDNVPQLTALLSLRDITIQQIGCTLYATYALAAGVLHAWGDNGDGSLGIGHGSEDVLEPTVVDCNWRRACSLRCSGSMVLVHTDTKDALYWGTCQDGTTVPRPRLVEECSRPRDIFARGSDSGGTVKLANSRVGEAGDSQIEELQSKIHELQADAEESGRRERASNEARHALKLQVKDLMSRFNRLQTESASKGSGTTGRDSASGEERSRKNIESELAQLKESHFRAAQMLSEDLQNAVTDARLSMESKLHELDTRIAVLHLEVGESRKSETAQKDHTALTERVASLEEENEDLKMQNRELKMNYRELTMDFRDLNFEHQKLLAEYQGATGRASQGTGSSSGHHGFGSKTSKPEPEPDLYSS